MSFHYNYKPVFVAFALAVATSGNAFAIDLFGNSVQLKQCPHPVQVTDCKKDSGGVFACSFENNVGGDAKKPLLMWSYTKDNVQISDPTGIAGLDGMKMGKKKRLQIAAPTKETATVIFCGGDPSKPMLQQKLRSIEIK